jgi:hypothetical protein
MPTIIGKIHRCLPITGKFTGANNRKIHRCLPIIGKFTDVGQ